jgi:ABC-type multidrug transport system ATPase subunit
MMVTLKKLASMGCTLIFTIYQSSTEVFGLFDRICLLSNGNTLFFGETLACLQVNNTVYMIFSLFLETFMVFITNSKHVHNFHVVENPGNLYILANCKGPFL